MNTADLLADAFARIRDEVHAAIDGLSDERIARRPTEGTNSIGWLVWHLLRIQDDHVADVAGLEQVWTAQGWADRFALPFEPGETGYAHTAPDVANVRVSADLLAAYNDAVHAQSATYVASLTDSDLDRIVDQRWDPPVTLGVRLVSVVADDLQHVGQAAYVRGLLAAS
jgi:uncharacterized damage-inducible protein DinB